MDASQMIPANGQGLREAPPILPIEVSRPAAPTYYPQLQAQDSMLREYLRVLIKRKWVVISSVLIIFGVVATATMRTTRIYEAAGSIAINKTDPALLNLKDSANGAIDYDPSDLDTEVSILRSDLLALQVIKQLNLDKRPEFGGSGDTQPSSLELTTDALQPDSASTSELLAAFKGSLQVSLRPNTRVIDIHYRSADKDLAAHVVNSLIHTYIEQNFKTRFESTMQASDWLSKQLIDLQMKVETSQEKLVKYQKQHEILGIDEKQNIITSKLDELNKELTTAESGRMEKESVYQLVQSGDADTAAAAATSADAPAPGGATISSLLEKLREQQADLKIQVAQLSTQFGPSYPKVAQMNNQMKEVDAQIQVEMKKIVSRVRSDYLTALQRETMLRAAMDKQKQEPNVPRNLSFALALGLTTGIGLAFLLEGIDNTVRTPEQAQALSGLPSLGLIPLGSKNGVEASVRQRLAVASSKEVVELVTQSRPQSQMAESYRALRTSLLLTSLGAPPKVILITSALPQEGKTTTSINTAIVLAQKGVRVLLIDADLRRPSIHKTLGMGPKMGLSNVLTGNATIQQATVRSSILPGLFILPAGTPPPNPAELLASSNMKDVLAELREQYDHIVVDTPPALSVTDAVVMSTRADAVVLVIRSGQTTKQALRRSRDLLMQVNARVAGVLLNAVDLTSPDYYYYYEYQGKYGHRYYCEDELDSAAESAPKISSGSA